jgi:Uma2 family endonuclease
MATAPEQLPWRVNDYPTTDGKPMAETDWHRDLMVDLIQTLQDHYAAHPRVYVSGNLLVFYEPGDKRRHLSPDVFVVKGVAKHQRPNYLIWEEKRPELVIELTSSSTRHADTVRKFRLYQDVWQVPEYFLFDPLGDYLDPRLQGYRLRDGRYEAVRQVRRRLPSQVLKLHLEPHGRELRLYDARTGHWLLTTRERAADTEVERAARQRAEAERRRERAARERAEAELERLRQEVESLRRRPPAES